MIKTKYCEPPEDDYEFGTCTRCGDVLMMPSHFGMCHDCRAERE